MAKKTNLESPNFPIVRPGRSAGQAMGEALELEHRHEEWHEEHPGEICPPEFMNANTYEDIRRGEKMLDLGGGSFEPGDAFLPRGRK